MTTPFDAQSLLLIEAIGAAMADWRISLNAVDQNSGSLPRAGTVKTKND